MNKSPFWYVLKSRGTFFLQFFFSGNSGSPLVKKIHWKKFRSYSLALVFLFGFFGTSISVFAQFSFPGIISRVTDGDTVQVRSGDVVFRVRLYGIDAPERTQPFGIQSTQALIELVSFDRDTNTSPEVMVVVMDVDRYGRLIGRLFRNDREINIELLRLGLAWHYVVYDQSREYSDAQLNAQWESRGLWSDAEAIPPWEWRSRE